MNQIILVGEDNMQIRDVMCHLQKALFLQQRHIRRQHLKHITRAAIHACNQRSILPQLLMLN